MFENKNSHLDFDRGDYNNVLNKNLPIINKCYCNLLFDNQYLNHELLQY